MINEKKLSALIKKDYTRIVNLFGDYFQYTNGIIVANCGYENHQIIQTLFKVGALENYRNLTPKTSRDLSNIMKSEKEIEAEETQYIKDFISFTARVFKIQGKYYIYDTKYVDVFQHVTYKVSIDKETTTPILRVYENEKLIGLILPIREFNSNADETIKGLEGLEV